MLSSMIYYYHVLSTCIIIIDFMSSSESADCRLHRVFRKIVLNYFMFVDTFIIAQVTFIRFKFLQI